jgi:hypothetical protein
MTTLVSFASSGHIRVKLILLVTDQRRLRTINDHRDFVVDGLNLAINTGHSIVDSMRGPQDLRSCHPNLLICQRIQPLQRIFYVSLSNQLLQVFF